MVDDLDKETPDTQDDSQTTDNDGFDEATKQRYLEQIEGNKKDALKLRERVIESEVQKAKQDETNLLELHKKDPKIAIDVAKKLGYQDWKTFETKQKGNDLSEYDKLEQFYQKKKAEEKHQEAISESDRLLGEIKDETKRQEAKEFFERLVGDKIIDKKTATEFVELATLYVMKEENKIDLVNNGLKMLASTGIKSEKPTGKQTESEWKIQNGRAILNPKFNK